MIEDTTAAHKDCGLELVISIATARAFTNFQEMGELAEFLLGHSIWTHEFADGALWNRLRYALLQQHPQLSAVKPEHFNDDWKAELLVCRERYGNSFRIVRGKAERQESPLASIQRLAPHLPVIVIETEVPDAE